MDYNYRCMGCMHEQFDFTVPCPNCGYTEHQNKPGQLPVRSILHNQYIIGRSLGAGGFGITYIGFDIHLLKRVCIKEYFLGNISWRDRDGFSVCCNAEYAKRFNHEKARFIEEARVLAQLDDQPGVVKVLNYFEENQTAYIVMDYVEGKSLRSYVKEHGGKLTPMETFSLLRPVVQSLATMHAKGIVHLDISPSNIMLTERGVAKLIDFGAAKGRNKDLNSDKVFKKTYSPIEQRTPDGQIGSYSDVYALCATFYEILTGQKPVGSLERQAGEPMYSPRQYGIGITSEQEQALINGLAIEPDNRIQSAADLYFYLYAQDDTTANASNALHAAIQNSHAGSELLMNALEEEKQRRQKGQKIIIAAVAASFTILVALVVILVVGKPSDNTSNQSDNRPDAVTVSAEPIPSDTFSYTQSSTEGSFVEYDDKLRDQVYDVLATVRASEGSPDVVVNPTYEEVATRIAEQCINTPNPGSDEWNTTIQTFINDELASYGLSQNGWLLYSCMLTYPESVLEVLEEQIDILNSNASGTITLRNCNSVGIGCRTHANGFKYWIVIFL